MSNNNSQFEENDKFMQEIFLFCVTAVTCMPKAFSHVIDTTNTSVRSKVRVSCPDGQQFKDSSVDETNITSTCSEDGTWDPDIPDCQGTNGTNPMSP
jgi:hypothetical protein